VSRVLAGRLARGGSIARGWLELDGERIVAAGDGPPPRRPDEELEGIAAPGLLDLQVNGAGGHEVTGGAAALDAIDAVQLAHGVTSYLPALLATDDAATEEALGELAERAADPASPVAGVHLEGPFLDRAHAGMHPAERLRAPAGGVPGYFRSEAVKLVTLAPELAGAPELIAGLRARDVAVSLGHSGASAAEVAASSAVWSRGALSSERRTTHAR